MKKCPRSLCRRYTRDRGLADESRVRQETHARQGCSTLIFRSQFVKREVSNTTASAGFTHAFSLRKKKITRQLDVADVQLLTKSQVS